MVEDCVLGAGVRVYDERLVNLYGCEIGDDSTVAPFVEIQRGAVIGRRSKICSHAFICGGAHIGDRVFVGHGVMFVNDLYPVIDGPTFLETVYVEDDVSIGSGAVILPVRIGRWAIVGAGAVVTKDVPQLSIVAGNPARVLRRFTTVEERTEYLYGKACDHRHAPA